MPDGKLAAGIVRLCAPLRPRASIRNQPCTYHSIAQSQLKTCNSSLTSDSGVPRSAVPCLTLHGSNSGRWDGISAQAARTLHRCKSS